MSLWLAIGLLNGIIVSGKFDEWVLDGRPRLKIVFNFVGGQLAGWLGAGYLVLRLFYPPIQHWLYALVVGFTYGVLAGPGLYEVCCILDTTIMNFLRRICGLRETQSSE